MLNRLVGAALLLAALAAKIAHEEQAHVMLACAFLGYWTRHWMPRTKEKTDGK